MNTINTTVIIPIHRLDEKSTDLTIRAIESLNSQKDKNFKLLLVVSTAVNPSQMELLTSIPDKTYDVQVATNEGETDYQSQINFAATHVETEFFTILQYDDILFDNYVANVNEHVGAYQYDAYLGITLEKDDKQNFLGFSNETTWAINHMEKFGLFDIKNAKNHNFHNYNLCGLTVKKDVFLTVGGFKKSMVKFHDYEFLLRLLNVGKKVYVIPKFMYEHVNGREDSMFSATKNMGIPEVKFWYDSAKKEYHFDYDREIAFA